MNLEELANFGDFIAAVAVVASLIYLAVQIRHANALAKADAYRNILQDFQSHNRQLIENPELHRIIRSGVYAQEPLNETEQELLGLFLMQMFWAMNSAYHSSWLDPGLFEFIKARIDVYMSNPVIREWWDRQRGTQPEPFRSIVDERRKELANIDSDRWEASSDESKQSKT